MKGRPAIPTELKILKGTFRQDEHDKRQPKLSSDPPVRPKDFNAAQRKIWASLQAELEKHGHWSSTYGFTAEMFCRCWCHWLECEKDIAKNGPRFTVPLIRGGKPVTVKKGRKMVQVMETKTNPALIEYSKLQRELRALCGELGLHPSALAKLKG